MKPRVIETDELIVDNFAGGGGASVGIEMALGRPADIAINHDPEALKMHAANHPHTKHLCENVWAVDIVKVVAGRKVGLAWFLPDCKHFSKAKGGKPVEKKIRGLAWVALRWMGLVRPRIVCLENVEEFQDWGPVVDGQPCKRRKGMTFKRWVTQIRNLGYTVDWRELRACDYGAPTIRKRLFVVARCDGQKITWPEPTHSAKGDLFLEPYRTAADCIDWSIPCASIFLTRAEGRALGVNRPLADATMRRIARGVKRYVIDAAQPFIVPIANYDGTERVHSISDPLRTVTANPKGGSMALVTPFVASLTHHGENRCESLEEPLKTITGAHRGEKAFIVPTIIQTGYGEREGQEPRVPGLDKPLGTVVAGGVKHAVVSTFLSSYYGEKSTKDVRGAGIAEPIPTVPTENRHALVAAFLSRQFGASIGSGAGDPVGTTTAGGGGKSALVAAFLAQHNAGPHNDNLSGRHANEPISTITATGGQQQIVASSLVKLRGTCRDGQPVAEPMATVSAGGTHIGEVRAFLLKYFGTDQDPRLEDPMHTITSKHRFGLVTVHGEDYVIVDIGMRMLSPRELFRAQGFPDSYIIDRGLTKTAQVRMCGNSVSPYPAAALVRAQFFGDSAEVAA
jgi:DNA (cytosine-5)-methyltransferase 1